MTLIEKALLKEKIFGNLDYPITNEIQGSDLEIDGWAFTNLENEVIIEIIIDNTLIKKILRGKQRPDVKKAHPSISDALMSGFYCVMDLSNYENKTHNLKVIAKTKTSQKVLSDINFILDKSQILPPLDLRFVGEGDFVRIGQAYVEHFINYCKLKPNERVLDVGCGIGRIALPLTKFISEDGCYFGFDIVKKGIDWCQNNISTKFPNFNFEHFDVYNKEYNKNGKQKASDFKFPYKNKYFDFVVATSLFTHLLPNDAQQYLEEISRVLKKNGRCFVTIYLLNEKSLKLMSKSLSSINFQYHMGKFRTFDKNNPESGLAYEEDFILDLFKESKLNIQKPIHYGVWCNKEDLAPNKTDQDIIIVKRKTHFLIGLIILFLLRIKNFQGYHNN